MTHTNLYMKPTYRTFTSLTALIIDKLCVTAILGITILATTSFAHAQSALCCDKTASGLCVQPMPGRPSSSRVSEPARFTDLYKRMDKLDTGNCANAYFLHKTQAWLNLSRDFYHEGDGSTATNAAYDEAEKIIKDIEAGKVPSSETAMIQDSAKLRSDLWQIASDRKSTPALLSSAAREVAYCEVYLVRAGHAQTNLGGKARVEPLIGMAQDICSAIKEKPKCVVDTVKALPAQLPVVVKPILQIATPKETTSTVVATFTLNSDALFDVNKAIVKQEGKAKIDTMLASLQSAKYSKIVVVGHTDSSGSNTYNKSLSVRRALAVKSYLVAKGVDASLIGTDGMGEINPIASNRTLQGKALNRRVEIEVLNVSK